MGIGNDDHDVCVRSKGVDESCKSRISDLHSLELGLCLTTGQLELLDNVGYLIFQNDNETVS